MLATGLISPVVRLYARGLPAARPRNSRTGEELRRSLLNQSFVAEAGEPVNIQFATEPRELPLGVLPRRLLYRGARINQRRFSAQDFSQFAVADEVERLGFFT